MRAKMVKPFLWLTTFIVIVGLACSASGGGGDNPPATREPNQPQETQPAEPATQEPEPVEPATQEPEPDTPAGGAVSSLDGVKNAVIQIESQGTFVNPDFTVSFNAAGRGSGFIIDPSGLAITNNHVVTGAGLFKVWIGGDTTKTYNARVLGVSECSDLAVIDISGDGYPYLDWHNGSIGVGLEVYAAGFPLGEPEFSLTKGIVSKERAGGETSWASVDYVIEHDATLNPGNSGGPLLDENGKVVGINYRKRETGQFYAIGSDLAQQVVAELKEGKDLETFGVNGEAFAGDNFSGIWVYSVESGSPADKAGLTGGDIITTLEDLILGSDGTMADYCDILRSHSSGDTLDIEVLRYFTSEVLVGQINGRELETAATFDPGTGGDTGGDTGGATDGYSGYTTFQDDFGAIQIDLPNEWTDIDGSNWVDGDAVIGSGISAAANLDNYYNTWTESGVFFGASDDLATLGGYVNLLDVRRDYYIQYCKLRERGDYEDAFYRGKYDEYYNCEDTGNVFVVLTAVPRDNSNSFLILVEIQITKEADREALTKILESFQVVGSLP